MRFSIVVPVYNVEDYLAKCLDSIVNQTFSDYEVIIVDDETPDNSMAIAEKYVAACPDKWQIIRQKNKGLGGARNTGAEAAKGEYLVFLDSDDFIHERMLEILDRHILETPCEMLIFNYSTATPSGTVITAFNFNKSDEVIAGDAKKRQMANPPSAWNKIYLRSFFMESGVRFPEKLLYEDVVTRLLIAKAEKIYLCKDNLYYYVQRSGSIMNSKVSPRVLEIKTIVDLVLKKCEEDDACHDFKDAIDTAMIYSLMCVIENIIEKERNHPFAKNLVQYLIKTFSEYSQKLHLFPFYQNKVACLLKGNLREYYFRVYTLPRMKQALLKIPVVSKINDLRKGNK